MNRHRSRTVAPGFPADDAPDPPVAANLTAFDPYSRVRDKLREQGPQTVRALSEASQLPPEQILEWAIQQIAERKLRYDAETQCFELPPIA